LSLHPHEPAASGSRAEINK